MTRPSMTRRSYSASVRRLAAGVLVVAAALAPLGCASGTRTISRGDDPTDARTGLVTRVNGVRVVHDDWADLGYRWEWAAEPRVRGGSDIEEVIVQDGVILAIDGQSNLSLIDTRAGRLVWTASAASKLTRFVGLYALEDSVLAVSTGAVYAFDRASGNILARQPLERSVDSRPAVVGGVALFGTPAQRVLAHRFGRDDGSLLPSPYNDGITEWQYRLEGVISSRPAITEGIATVVTQSGGVSFIKVDTAAAIGPGLRIFGGVETDPTTDGVFSYVASLDQSVYAFSPVDGVQQWRYLTGSPLRSSPVPHDGMVYISVPGEGLTAIERISGEPVWVNPDAAGEVVGLRRGELVVWDAAESVCALVDPGSGDVITKAKLRRVDRLLTDDFVDGNMYAVDDSGTVLAFSPR